MHLRFGTRPSDSPWIDRVWTCESGRVTEMTSVASETWGLMFWSLDGRSHAAVAGPETRTGTAPVPKGATWVGIQFAVGTAPRMIAAPSLVDGGIVLPDTTRRSFRLDGGRFETPGPDDAEALVSRLVGDGVVVGDPLVAHDRPPVG